MDTNDVKSLLDIGANVGNYSKTIKYFIPDMKILMIEANPHCEKYLMNTGIDYKIACLSDSKKEVDFYLQDDNDVGTGSSYYLENTEYYSKKRSVKRNTDTLDDLIGDDAFQFIKMDTQGSEIDIIKGGLSTLNKASYVSIELSLIEYNINSPLKKDVIEFMEENGFYPIQLVEEHYSKGKLIQEDWIFTKI